ncbi:MAG TPA: alpha/beta hydrolase [Aliidongia sp.]|uniref:alpha/beta hydrolase n=1 Tax=Aliidongia sp. TaxID=1914230 RepID=UPI002DDD64C7|nr:alpha/beta hydrolase [Aliidongia sp.]HEV2676767.1 alpha/beta hydrolase [Aliidongia sp.]
MIQLGPLSAVHDHPMEQLRQTLDQLRLALIGAGCGPHHMTGMVWATTEPALFDPADLTVDLAYREVFAGFRPPITVEWAAPGSPRLSIRAEAQRPAPPPAGALWRGYDLPNLIREYSPRVQVPAVAPIFTRCREEGAAFLSAHTHREIAYGAGPRERLDLLRPTGIAEPRLHVFIHGGYWQAMDKGNHVQFTRAFLEAGYAVAALNYSLVPDKPLDGLVEEIRAALAFLWRQAPALGLAQLPFDLAGHSAGGHLGAMAVATDWTAQGLPPDLVGTATLLSGLYELEPLTHLPMAALLGLDRVRAHHLSPTHLPAPATRILLAVGELESDEFKHQTALLGEAWHIPAERRQIVPGRNHFTIVDEFAEGPLALAALANAAPSVI